MELPFHQSPPALTCGWVPAQTCQAFSDTSAVTCVGLLKLPPLPIPRADNRNGQGSREGSDLIDSMLQSFRICSRCSESPGDSLSFGPGSSLGNKWEQYFIYAQVINFKGEEEGELFP